MKKEVVAVCSILVIIFTTNFICQKYLNIVSDEITKNLDKLHTLCMEYLDRQNDEENKIKENKITIEEKTKEISDKWEKHKEILSLYIEHGELEKIDVNIVKIRGFQEVNKYDEVIQAINECIFMFNHIKHKYMVCLANLF